MTDRWIRASDQERERVVGLLREAYAAGRLDHDEFDERSTAAYSAKTRGELCDLIADLPAMPVFPLELPAAGVNRRQPYRRAGSVTPVRAGPGLLFLVLLAAVGLIIATAAATPGIAVLLVVLSLVVLRIGAYRR